MRGNIIQLIAATIGAAGFSALFNLKGKKLIYATIGGFLSWSVYLLSVFIYPNVYLGGFISSVAVTLFAECMARFQKSPVTVFLVSGAIPLFPGGALYSAMNCLVMNDMAGFSEHATYTLLFAACMSAGITCTTVVFQNIISRFKPKTA